MKLALLLHPTRRMRATIGAIFIAMLLASLVTTQRLSAEASAAPAVEDKPTETPPESAPVPDQPRPAEATPPAESQPHPEPPTDPSQVLEEALNAMDAAARELEGDGPSPNVVPEQELAVQLLQKLLSAPQSSSNSQPQSTASPQPQAPNSESEQQPSESDTAPNGSGGRRADDENSQESSENVAGPTQSGSSTLAPKARANSVWGHLPPRQQESLLRSLSDSFLPEYESQIKRYYEALAEGKNNGRRP